MSSATTDASPDASIGQGTMLPLRAIERWAAAATVRDRSFRTALAIAALLHASFLLEIVRHTPRQIGEAGGDDQGISISIVTEADLQSQSTVPEIAEPPPGPAVTAQKPAPAPPPAPQPPQETEQAQPPIPEPSVAEPLAPEPKTAPPETPPPDAIRPSLADDVPDLLSIPDKGPQPAKKAEAAKPEHKAEPQPHPPQQQQAQKQQRTAKLDLTPPAEALNPSAGGGGRSAGATRPPGITRSGANDDFARNVIRELQKTMPQLRETLGRVTVRIFLNENGNVSEVQVVKPSEVASLDQSVIFAVKQTSFPFPPPNANTADRTFFVTYIYH